MNDAPSSLPVLLIGVDTPIGLTVLRELGQHGVPVICVGRGPYSLGRHSRYCSHFVDRPAGPIAQWLAPLVKAHRIGAVMAISESDLVQLAALDPVEQHCAILAPRADRMALVLDKQETLDLARDHDIATPASWQPSPGDTIREIAQTLVFPVAVKWADPPAMVARLEAAGIALEKVEYAVDAPALCALLAKYNALGAYPLVQTYCPGYGLGQMLNMHGGKATLRFQHRRLREWPVSGGVSTFCEAVPLTEHSDQMARSEALLAAIGWEGPAMVEYRYDPATGTYWLMEVNGRFWGSIPLAHHAGAWFGWEAWRTQLRGDRDIKEWAGKRAKARYAIPDIKHLAAIMRDGTVSVPRRLGFAARFALAFLDPRVGYYVWSWRDPGPFFADMRGVLAKIVRRGS